jgi:hypothetical protein
MILLPESSYVVFLSLFLFLLLIKFCLSTSDWVNNLSSECVPHAISHLVEVVLPICFWKVGIRLGAWRSMIGRNIQHRIISLDRN